VFEGVVLILRIVGYVVFELPLGIPCPDTEFDAIWKPMENAASS
jgi:hypothetical protein